MKHLAITDLRARRPLQFHVLLPAVQELARIRSYHTCCIAIGAAQAIMDALAQPLADMLTDRARWYPVDLPAAAGASQPVVAEAEVMREEVHPPISQRPAPVAPVVKAAPVGAEAYAVTQLFPWMTISPSDAEPTAAKRPPHDDDSCCVVCMDAPRTTVVGHSCAHPPVLCGPCAAVLMGQEQALCPVCRASA